MNNRTGKVLSGVILGGTLIGMGYYLSNNKQLNRQISKKVMGSLNDLSENSHELVNKVEHSLHSLAEVSSEVQEELAGKVEKGLNTLSDNSHEIQNHITDLVSETKNSLKHSLKDSVIRKQFVNIIGRLAPALFAMPKERFLIGFTLGSAVTGIGYYIYSNKQQIIQIPAKFKNLFNSHKVQDKLTEVVDDTKSNLNDTVQNVESSIDKSLGQFSDTVRRLNAAFHAGRDAVKESLNNTKSDIDKTNVGDLKSFIEKSGDVAENKSTENIATSKENAKPNLNKILINKTGNDHNDRDKPARI